MENNIDYGLLYESIMQNVLDSDYLTLEDLSDFSMSDNTELVTEAYVGKTKECLQLEAEFAKLKNQYEKDGGMEITRAINTNIANSDSVGRIEKIISKMFGFRKTYLVIRNMTVVNAMTAPRSTLLSNTTKHPGRIVENGKRYYDTEHNYTCYLFMYSEIFHELTPAELTACIIHEVGHNFDNTISAYIFDTLFWAIDIAFNGGIFRLVGPEIVYIKNAIGKFLDQTKIWPAIWGLHDITIKYISLFLGPIGKVSKLSNIAEALATNPNPGLLIGGFRFESEAFADNFAASYGYGPEVISMSDKFDRLGLITNKGFLPELWTGLGDGPLSILLMLIDPHPENQTRARMVLDAMKKCSEDRQNPPGLRKAITQNYVECKKAYDKFLQVEKDDEDGQVTRVVRAIKDKYLGGKMDLRAYLLALTNPALPTRSH